MCSKNLPKSLLIVLLFIYLGGCTVQPIVIGDEEIVYDWTEDRCSVDTLPDLPVRAFRDAEGLIQLNLSFERNFRLTGPDFTSLEPDCRQATLTSDVDIDPSHYNFREWMGSTYTLDGQTVYALVHNEWHGKDATRWHAERDFSDEQGFGRWYYQSWSASTYQDMHYDADQDRWYDADQDRWPGDFPLCQIWRTFAHPDLGCEATRTWVSPISDTVTVSGIAGDEDPGGGNGVVVTILKADTVLWSATLENGDTEGQAFNLEVPVQAGDRIHFRVHARGDAGWDTTYFSPKINIGPDPCLSGEHENCLMMSITSAVSVDGGRSFDQPEPPRHLVATLPYQWEPDAGHFAMWQPSNIVKNPNDNYYYALIQFDRNPRGEAGYQGMCVVRTLKLDDPKSWRAWDGTDFKLRFRDPYRQEVDPVRDTCFDVSESMGGVLTYSLTYNSYFEQFIAVAHNIFRNPPGFYYSLSDDLINWTEMELLMAADLLQTADGQMPYLAYPSLVDHESQARNFDVTGQRNFLYFTRVNSTNPLDFDLIRVPIEFYK